jgi:hypothetical protein
VDGVKKGQTAQSNKKDSFHAHVDGVKKEQYAQSNKKDSFHAQTRTEYEVTAAVAPFPTARSTRTE